MTTDTNFDTSAITVTPSALAKIREILSEDDNAGAKLRAYVEGGGCSGMSYGFAVEQEQNEDDYTIAGTDGLILVDSMSMQYLEGATIDWVEDLMGSSFRIDNPNAETTCGCGSSFNVGDSFWDHQPHYDYGE